VQRSVCWSCLLTVVVAASLAACRTAPPSASGSGAGAGSAPKVVSQREGGAALADKVIIDAACSDFANEQDQVVCITNQTEGKVDIGEWLIRNTLGRTFYFPPGAAIEPGQSVQVHTGAGANDAKTFYWNYEFKPVFDRKEQIVLVTKGNVDISRFTTP
jgi:lamin tail-like protein